MHPDLQIVIELQQTDLRIAELTSQIDALPSQIRAVEAQLADFLKAYDERKQRLAANQKERREWEAEIQGLRARIARHRDQLYEVKTNEQYRALLAEIEAEEMNNRAIEDKILENMLEAEQLEKFVREAAAHLEGEKARVAMEVRRLQSIRDQDAKELEEARAHRQALAGSLDAAVRDLYEKIRKARRGQAVAQVVDGSCSGCHVRLRPQAYNEVRTTDSLMTCETCGRILYYVQPPSPESGGAGGYEGRAGEATTSN